MKAIEKSKRSIFLKAKSKMITYRMKVAYFMKLGVQEDVKSNPGNYCISAGLAIDEI